jgi:hypothetical protein
LETLAPLLGSTRYKVQIYAAGRNCVYEFKNGRGDHYCSGYGGSTSREVAHVGSEGVLEVVEETPILGYRGYRNMAKEFTYYRTRFEASVGIEGLDGEVDVAVVQRE